MSKTMIKARFHALVARIKTEKGEKRDEARKEFLGLLHQQISAQNCADSMYFRLPSMRVQSPYEYVKRYKINGKHKTPTA